MNSFQKEIQVLIFSLIAGCIGDTMPQICGIITLKIPCGYKPGVKNPYLSNHAAYFWAKKT